MVAPHEKDPSIFEATRNHEWYFGVLLCFLEVAVLYILMGPYVKYVTVSLHNSYVNVIVNGFDGY